MTELCATVDRIEALDGAARAAESPEAGRLLDAEARQQRVVLGRLTAALRLPADDGGRGSARPVRRSARGFYGGVA